MIQYKDNNDKHPHQCDRYVAVLFPANSKKQNPEDKCKIFKEIRRRKKYQKERNVINLNFICDQVHNKVGRDGRLCDQVGHQALGRHVLRDQNLRGLQTNV